MTLNDKKKKTLIIMLCSSDFCIHNYLMLLEANFKLNILKPSRALMLGQSILLAM